MKRSYNTRLIAPAVLAYHSPRTCIQVSTSNHSGDLNSYTTAMRLMTIILTDDAIKHTCVWPLAWCNKWKPYNSSTPLQSDFSPFRSPVKEKGKQGRMKGLTRAQWINLNRNNRSVLASRYSVLWEKNWPNSPTASGSYGREAGREAGRRNTGGFRSFKTSLQVKLFGILICLISLQFYYGIRTAFSRLLSS